MKKIKNVISASVFVLLFSSFLFAPVNVVLADDTASEKTTSDSAKDADKEKKEKAKGEGKAKGKGKGKGKNGEEPDCE